MSSTGQKAANMYYRFYAMHNIGLIGET